MSYIVQHTPLSLLLFLFPFFYCLWCSCYWSVWSSYPNVVLTSFLSTLALSLGCIYSAEYLHNKLVEFVLRWPMEMFDITPIGRVVNRFSKDVDTCDNTLPLNLRVAVMQLFAVIPYSAHSISHSSLGLYHHHFSFIPILLSFILSCS